MSKYNSLLVAVDFRETSSSLCKEAIFIAKTLKAEVTLVHAIEYLPYYPYYPYNTEKVQHDLLEGITSRLDSLKEEFVKEGIIVNDHVIKEGKAHKVICNCADEVSVCAIIIGVGDHYLLENLIGSTAEKVVRMAKQAVILINNHTPKEGFRRILCGFDFSENSKRALTSAIYMAGIFNAHLDVVHVIHEHHYFSPDTSVIDPASPAYAEYQEIIEKARQCVSEKMREILYSLDIHEVCYETHILKGKPVTEISQMIESANIDLLVIGASGHSTFANFFLGSTTEKLIQKAPCSIMTLKD